MRDDCSEINSRNSLVEIIINSIKKPLSTGLFWVWVSILVIVLDRLSKLWVMNHLTFLEPFKMTSFFNLTLAYNRGAAFSFLHQASGWQHILLGGLAVIVSITVLIALIKSPYHMRWFNIALSLILGGALGNAADRVLYGYVIDFFDFHLGDWHFAIFNVADSAISVGAFMLICHWLFSKSDKDSSLR